VVTVVVVIVKRKGRRGRVEKGGRNWFFRWWQEYGAARHNLWWLSWQGSVQKVACSKSVDTVCVVQG
jgi:hypothetical protein